MPETDVVSVGWRGGACPLARAGRVWLVSLLFVAGCADEEAAPVVHVVSCPTLFGDGEDYVGIVAPTGGVEPFACVEASFAGRVVGVARATADGSFAIRLRRPAELRARPVELAIDGYVVHVTPEGDAEATVAYEPSTLPLVERPAGRVMFLGHLASVDGGTPVSEAWLVNWSSGAVSPIDPSPRLDEPFFTDVAGRAGDEAAPVSRHESGGAGGCWWPLGGGGAAACKDEDVAAGRCRRGAGAGCTTRRGCEPLAVEERGPPPMSNELPWTIPVEDDRTGPEDAGPREDGGFE